MQIFEKYRSDYKKSLQLLQAERDRFMSELKTIPTIRVIPSRSNFFMVESQKISSTDLTKILLTEENIFVKDLSAKTHGSHLRLSIRNPLENDRLIDALKKNIVKGILKWEKFLLDLYSTFLTTQPLKNSISMVLLESSGSFLIRT